MGVPVNSLLEIRLNVVTNGQRSTNVLHYNLETDFVGLSLTEEYDQIWSYIGGPTPTNNLLDAFAQLLGTNASFESVDLQYVKAVRYVGKSYVPAYIASQTAASEAQNVSAVVVKRSTRAGKSFRGSVHVPAIPVNHLTGGSLSAGYLAALGIFATELTMPIQGNPVTGRLVPIIYTRKNTQFPWGDDLVNAIPQTEIRTMRSRTKGYGI